METIKIAEIIKTVNRGRFRRSSIPQELASGWPCVHYMGKTLCATIPYYFRKIENERVALYPLYCSVTVPLGNPERVMDFTVFPYQTDWYDVDYSRPAGYFRHEALATVKRSEYNQMRADLFSCYDALIACKRDGYEYTDDGTMSSLFSVLMEPCHFEQYLKINKSFYIQFCKL